MDSLVSVIIPVYNVEKFVFEAITSIQNQTYKNLEIIIVDDGSTDNTFNVVKVLAEGDSRIKLFRNNKNRKIVKTLNKAYQNSTGSYIARMDGDDISEPDRIEKKVEFLKNNPTISLVGCSVSAISEDGIVLSKTVKNKNIKLLDKLKKYSTPVLHIWVARREVYEKLNGYRELSGVEDYDFLLRMSSSGLLYSNLEGYFGYKIRIDRKGNTKDLIGLKQILLHKYAYNLYLQRLKNGYDDFNGDIDNMLAVSSFTQKIYNFSRTRLICAIEDKKDKKYLMMFVNLCLSLISPHQAYYLKNKLLARVITNSFNKS